MTNLLKSNFKKSAANQKARKFRKQAAAVFLIGLLAFELGNLLGFSGAKIASRNNEVEFSDALEPANTASAEVEDASAAIELPPNLFKYAAPKNVRVPILTYHAISYKPQSYKDPNLVIKPKQLEAQIKYLYQHRYNTISLTDLYGAMYLGKKLPPKPVILTFDDGLREQYRVAFPILKKYRKKATFFVTPCVFDRPSKIRYMTPEQLSEMSKAGMDIQSHTYCHGILTDYDSAKLNFHIAWPKHLIEKGITGKPVQFMSYPHNRYNNKVIRAVRDNEFLFALTSSPGKIQEYRRPYQLHRYGIGYYTSMAKFASIVAP